jgi:phosphohistidine phosphatase
MKELYIIRHAKTERIQANQRDFDRELTERGLRQCADLSNYIQGDFQDLDLILVSSAKRTQMTFNALNKVLDSKRIEFLPQLYLASAKEIMQIILDFAYDLDRVLLIGHNDGINDLVSYFLNDYQHVPTSGYLHFQFPVDSWEYITKGSGILRDSFFSAER